MTLNIYICSVQTLYEVFKNYLDMYEGPCVNACLCILSQRFGRAASYGANLLSVPVVKDVKIVILNLKDLGVLLVCAFISPFTDI